MQVAELIDAAATVAGNKSKLARLVGTTPQNLNNWRNGSRTCTPEDQALLAEIAGLNPEAALVDAMLKKHEGTPKGDLLKRALGKARGVAVMLIFGVIAAAAGAVLGVSTPFFKTIRARQCI